MQLFDDCECLLHGTLPADEAPHTFKPGCGATLIENNRMETADGTLISEV